MDEVSNQYKRSAEAAEKILESPADENKILGDLIGGVPSDIDDQIATIDSWADSSCHQARAERAKREHEDGQPGGDSDSGDRDGGDDDNGDEDVGTSGGGDDSGSPDVAVPGSGDSGGTDSDDGGFVPPRPTRLRWCRPRSARSRCLSSRPQSPSSWARPSSPSNRPG